MIVIMKKGTAPESIEKTKEKIESFGLIAHVSVGKEQTVIGAVGSDAGIFREQLMLLRDVERVVAIQKPYKFVSREFQKENSVIDIDGIALGGPTIQMIIGPCSVESREGLLEVAQAVKKSGAKLLRGGAYKPRTSPYAFQGHGEEALKLLKETKQKTGLKIVTELLDPRDAQMVSDHTDMIQIGARNMQNFRLLTEVGKMKKPVLLKRGISATIIEWLMSAEYIAREGNRQIVLCERGIRTYESETRNTLDLSAVPVLKSLTHLPVIVDPSHAVGKWQYVESMARAAIAAGADGLLMEVHQDPPNALCDGPQALRLERIEPLLKDLAGIAKVIGRKLSC